MGAEEHDLTFFHDEAKVVTSKGPRHVLVMTPRAPLRVGRERLIELRRSAAGSPIDDECVRRVRRGRGRIRAVLFRGRNDDSSASWGFAEDLGPDEELELAQLLVRSMNVTRRRLMAAGVLVHMHTEFSFRDADLCKRATERVIDELEGELAERVSPATTLLRLDLWALRHLTFYFTLAFDKVLSSVLPDKLPILERREHRVQELLAQLPADAL